MAVLNAANEVAVDEFLRGRIGFTDIARLIEEVLNQVTAVAADDLETILQADRQARRLACEQIGVLS